MKVTGVIAFAALAFSTSVAAKGCENYTNGGQCINPQKRSIGLTSLPKRWLAAARAAETELTEAAPVEVEFTTSA